jgi:cytochrome P450
MNFSSPSSPVFGIRSPTCETEHMERLYHLMENWSKVMETGNTPPVDIYPFLHYVPERFLGNWRSRASVVRDEMNSLYRAQVERVISRREASIVKDSFMDTVLNQNAKLGYTKHQLSFLGGVLMEGGSDTTSATIISCIQAMTRWPEIQRKAQAEIDSVVGEDRSPVWSDYENLPYIAATVKEAMRWRSVVPLGFPHCAAEGMSCDLPFPQFFLSATRRIQSISRHS